MRPAKRPPRPPRRDYVTPMAILSLFLLGIVVVLFVLLLCGVGID